MSLGPVMVDLAGPELEAEEREILRHPLVGGVILFTRNYREPEQVKALVEAIHAVRSPRLLVAVDQEGGRVQRFRDGFTPLPALRNLGRLFDREASRARRYARELGWLMATELREVGIDLSFAPVLDLDRGVSGVIGDRAFHGDPEAVADLAHHYVRGMREAGMEATGKHFPGHGSVAADSHLDLPVDERPLEEMLFQDLLPFERMAGEGIAAMMMAHVVYPAVDPLPASFSRIWIGEVLRGRLGFLGAVFSDDLSMEGAAGIGDHVDRALAALEAGCDMVIVCNNPEGRGRILDRLRWSPSPAQLLCLNRMHGRDAAPEADPAARLAAARELAARCEPGLWLDLEQDALS